jgi:hypothetical protein
VHNPQQKGSKQILRILLPMSNYKPKLWNRKTKQFVDCVYDVFEQNHYLSRGRNLTDYAMFVEADIRPEEVYLLKLVK